MNEVKLGSLINGSQERDAIHIAVAPVIAGDDLRRGQFIAFAKGSTETVVPSPPSEAIGIVDPFLYRDVKPRERFYMLLNPYTITGLRHEWTHPAFLKVDDRLRLESQVWLEAFASRLFSYYGKDDYEREWGSPFELLISCAETGFPTDIEYGKDCQPTDEFWGHYERYTGRKVVNRPDYFRCAC